MSKVMMIVDDSRVSRMMIKAIVQKSHSDWTLLEAEQGDDAIAKVKSALTAIDFFSVDYNMPGMDGLTLIENLRTHHAPSARFALLTANIQDAIRARAYDLEVLCVHKPITETSILEILEYFND